VHGKKGEDRFNGETPPHGRKKRNGIENVKGGKGGGGTLSRGEDLTSTISKLEGKREPTQEHEGKVGSPNMKTGKGKEMELGEGKEGKLQ